MAVRVLTGNCLDVLATLEPNSVQACVTSPPYYQLRAYGTEPQVWPDGWRGELGQEPTPDLFIAHLVEVFRGVRRVLRDDGVLMVNIGDSYTGGTQGRRDMDTLPRPKGGHRTDPGYSFPRSVPQGMKPKDLIGIPWMLAFALRADGWWLRGDYIWHKPAPMPESVRDRCTRSHEYVFHLTKRERYYWDQDAIRDPLAESSIARLGQDLEGQAGSDRANGGAKTNGSMKAVVFGGTKGAPTRLASGNPWVPAGAGANKRSVWTIATAGYDEAHFAVMPDELAETCIKATTRAGDTVLDPFGGAGTTALAADRLGRHAVSIELNPAYAGMQTRRLVGDSPLFADVSAA